MSLLPATSHANPTTPFWAKAGGGGGSTVVFGNATPVAWFKNFSNDDPGISNVANIQSFLVPTFDTNGKLVVQANWKIDSAGQDALFILGLSGSYEVITDTTNISSSKGTFGQSLTMTFDYTANTSDWSLVQQIELEGTQSDVDVGGTATMSVIFYPTP
jgi:hypothetical protein